MIQSKLHLSTLTFSCPATCAVTTKGDDGACCCCCCCCCCDGHLFEVGSSDKNATQSKSRRLRCPRKKDLDAKEAADSVGDVNHQHSTTFCRYYPWPEYTTSAMSCCVELWRRNNHIFHDAAHCRRSLACVTGRRPRCCGCVESYILSVWDL